MVQYDVVLNFVTKMNNQDASANAAKKVFNPLTKEAKNAKSNISKMIQPTDILNKSFGQMRQIEVFKGLGADASVFNDQLASLRMDVTGAGGDFDKMQKAAVKMSKSFDMSKLSMLFFGMAIQRLFMGIFNQMVNTFKLVDKKGIMPLNRALTKMEAAFAFLSFSIIKAMEPLLLPVIDAVVNLIDWFAQLPVGVQQAIGLTILALGLLGTALLTLGTIGLGMPVITDLIAKGFGSITDGAKMLSSKGISGLTTSFLNLLPVLLLVAVATFLAYETFKTFDNFGPELEKSFDSVGNSFSNLASRFNIDTSWMTDTLKGLRDNFEIYLQTGIAGTIVTFNSVVDTLIKSLIVGIDVLRVFAGYANIAWQILTGGDVEGATNALSDIGGEFVNSVSDWTNVFNDFGESISDVSKKSNELILMKDNPLVGENQDLLATDAGKSFIDKYTESLTANSAKIADTMKNDVIPNLTDSIAFSGTTPPSDGPLSDTPVYANDFIETYSQGLLDSAPYLNQTVTTVFTDATTIMKDIVHLAVESVISDVNRALDKIRQLEARKASVKSSSSSSTTNNNFNISSASGTDISRSIRNANIAVPTRF